MDIQRLVIVKPSGNITAIVFDEVPSSQMRQVGAAVQEEYPSVEQVLFVQKRGNSIHGQMAGGEFCGNAARSLGYVLANGQESTQTFSMSGLSKPVTVETSANRAKLKIETNLTHEKMSLGDAPVSVVHLEGISHAVLMPEHPLFKFLKQYAARPDRWNTVQHVLEDLGLTKQPACGLIFAEGKSPSVSITPYVLVRDIQTLYPETACASGSIAVASLMGSHSSIRQPSGEVLRIALKRNGTSVEADVDGSMAILWDGPAKNLVATRNASTGCMPQSNSNAHARNG